MSEKNINNVEQIRDIIFGSQIKDFESRFDKLSDSIKQLEKKMTKALEESHNKLKSETTRSIEGIEKVISNLTSSTQNERNKLKELINSTESNLKEGLDNQKDELSTKIKILNDNVADENRRNLETINKIKEEIEESLNIGLSNLSNDKVSRDSISKLLLDMAMNIQGTDVGSILNEDVKNKK